MWQLLQWLGLGPRCERCGFRLRIKQTSKSARFYVDPERWAARCKAIAIAGASPFNCPHLKRAAHQAVHPHDAGGM
jgi:hypothetical protein